MGLPYPASCQNPSIAFKTFVRLMKKSSLSIIQLLNSVLTQVILVFALTIACTAQVIAQPPKISVQGTLKSANGTPAPDGGQTITFRLYNTATGGSPLWEETSTVQVVGGIYSHYLGSVVPLNPSHFANTLYLGVVVGTFELVPRNQLAYAPYAFSVNVAQKVVCSGAVGDVKYSVLNPTEFALRNGDCWVPMDGSALQVDDSLRVIKGWTNLPDASGMFFRAQEFSGGANNDPDRTSASAIATAQTDALKEHNHTMNHSHTITDPGHKHGTKGWWGVGSATGNSKEATANGDSNDYGAPGNLNIMYDATTGISVNQHTGNTGNTGHINETRPKNLNLWVYIRIN